MVRRISVAACIVVVVAEAIPVARHVLRRPTVYVNADSGWSITVPAGWHTVPLHVDGDPSHVGGAEQGVAFSNRPIPSVRSTPLVWRYETTPSISSDAVLMMVYSSGPTAGAFPARVDSSWPPAFYLPPKASSDDLDSLDPNVADLQVDGIGYTALVWHGPDASHDDTTTARAALLTMSFPRLPATDAPQGPARMFVLPGGQRTGIFVLGDARHYPTDDPTRVELVGPKAWAPDVFLMPGGGAWGPSPYALAATSRDGCRLKVKDGYLVCPSDGRTWSTTSGIGCEHQDPVAMASSITDHEGQLLLSQPSYGTALHLPSC
jgi:hypothetical protein